MKIMLTVLLLIALFSPANISAQNDLRVTSLAWSPDGTRLAIGTSKGVQVYSAETAEKIWEAITENPVNVVQFNSLGTTLAAGLGSGTGHDRGFVQVWTVKDGEQQAYFEVNRFAVSVLAFSPDGQQLVTGGGYGLTRGGGDYRVRIWNTVDWKELTSIAPIGSALVTGAAYSSDGRYMMFSNNYGSSNLIDTATNDIVAAVHQDGANCITFDERTSELVLGFYRSVQVWELRSQPEIHLVRRINWNTSYSENVEEFLLGEYVIGCESDRFVTSSEDGSLRVRDILTSSVELIYSNEGRRFTRAAFSPDSTRLAFISDTSMSPISGSYQADYRVAIWTLNTSEPMYFDLD